MVRTRTRTESGSARLPTSVVQGKVELLPLVRTTFAQCSPFPHLRDDYHGGREGGGYREDYDRGHRGPPRGDRGGGHGRGEPVADDGSSPAMMSFKTFLGSQDDTITDDEAIKKYAEYKLEFKRQQLNEFFVSHKDEEW
jgi:hypothetical protein